MDVQQIRIHIVWIDWNVMNIKFRNHVLIINKIFNVCGKITNVELNNVKVLVKQDKQMKNVRKQILYVLQNLGEDVRRMVNVKKQMSMLDVNRI